MSQCTIDLALASYFSVEILLYTSGSGHELQNSFFNIKLFYFENYLQSWPVTKAINIIEIILT